MPFPEGIGLMFFNGTRGLVYYSSEAKRILVSNGGIVAQVVVESFPKLTAVSLGGAIASRSATWLTRKIDENYGVHLADVFDWLLNRLPQSVGWGYSRLARMVGTPQRMISTAFSNLPLPPQLHWVNDFLVSKLIAPVVEEVVYRGIIQKGLGSALALALTRFRVPPAVAHSLSGLIAVTLFAGAHNADPRSPQFRQTLICGITFGIMMYFYGLPGAVMTHSLNNISLQIEGSLGLG